MGAAALQLLWVCATAPRGFYLALNHLMLNIIFTLLYAAGQMFKFDTLFLFVFCFCLTSFLPKLSWSATATKSIALMFSTLCSSRPISFKPFEQLHTK